MTAGNSFAKSPRQIRRCKPSSRKLASIIGGPGGWVAWC
jgi:hypothetical protein